jgi:outer membrane protein TolC
MMIRRLTIIFSVIVLSQALTTPAFGALFSFGKKADQQEIEARKTKDRLVRSGKAHYNAREYEEAIKEWDKALLLDPGNKKIRKYINSATIKLERQRKKDLRLISITSPPKEAVRVLSLDECIDIAVKNSLPLKIAQKNIDLAELRIWEAKRNLLPKLSAIWEDYSGRIQSRRYIGKKEYFEGQQTLPFFQGAETYYIMKQAELNLRVVKEEYKKTKNELILQTRKSYYALARAKENLRLQTELKQEVDNVSAMVARQLESGVTTNLEYLNVSSQSSQVRYQLASAEGDEAMAGLMLKQTMNMDYAEEIDIEPRLEFRRIGIEFEDALRAAFMNRPEMKIHSITVEYNKYEIEISRAKGWPKVDIMGNYGLAKEEYVSMDRLAPPVGSNNIDPDRKLEQQWYWGFKVAVPVWGSTAEYSQTREQWVPVINAYSGTEAWTHTAKFNLLDKLSYFSDKLTAEIGLDRATQDFNKIKQDVTSEVKEGCFNYEKALILLETASNKVKFQEKDLELIKAKRGMDEAQDSNVVESMIKLAQERFGYVQALVDYYTAVASINKAIGVSDYFRIEGEK